MADDIATLGIKIDSTQVKKADSNLDSLTQASKKAESATEGLTAETQKAERATKKYNSTLKRGAGGIGDFSRKSGQAGIQLQQFIGQIQGGQSALLALSQQSADLGFVLGAPLLGAVAGISATLVSFLIPSLTDSRSAIEKLEDVIDELGDTLERTDGGILKFTKGIEDLAKRSESLARIRIASSIKDAEEQIKASADGIRESIRSTFGAGAGPIKDFAENIINLGVSFSDVPKTVAEVTAGIDGLGGSSLALKSISERINLLSESFGITAEQAYDLAFAVGEVQLNSDPTTIKRLQNAIEDINKETGQSNDKLREFGDALIPYFIATADATDAALFFRKALADLRPVTDQISDSIDDLGESSTETIVTIEQIAASIIAETNAYKAGGEELERYIALQQASAIASKLTKDATEDEIKALTKLIIERNKARTASRKTGGQGNQFNVSDLDKIESQLDRIGATAGSTGNVIVDAFGSAADAIKSYSADLQKLNDIESDIMDKRKKEGADQAALDKLQAKVAEGRITAEISGLQNLSSATASFFDEKTAAAKAFTALSQVLAATEIALEFQKIAASNTSAATTIANEGAKSSANALTAITSAFSAPWPSGFIFGAAMIGIMSSLGVFSGGGGSVDPTAGRQETQGTGTVLGDSSGKASSIFNSADRLEDIQIDQLAELRGIRNSISDLSNAINGVANDIVRGVDFGAVGTAGGRDQRYTANTSQIAGSAAGLVALSGGPAGLIYFGTKVLDKVLGGRVTEWGNKLIGDIFGKSKSKIVDSGITFMSQSFGEIFNSEFLRASLFADIETTKKKLFGIIKKTSTDRQFEGLDQEISSQFVDIFVSIGESVTQAAELLGMAGDDINARLNDFVVNIGDVSLEGLSGEEIQKELQAIFSQQADLIAEFLVPSLTEYQQIGEGTFETLIRVAQEQAIFNDSLELLGINLSNLSNALQIDIAQSIIDLVGGIEKFSDLSNEFFNEFLSEEEQFKQLTQSLKDVFSQLNEELPVTREGFTKLLTELNLTSEADQALFASLLELIPALDLYYDTLEDNALEALERAQEAAEAEAQLIADRDSLNQSIANRLESFGLDRFESALLNLEREFESLREEAERTGADLAAIEELYGMERERILEDQADELLRIEQELADRREALNKTIAQRLEGFELDQTQQALANLNREFEDLRDEANETGASLVDIERLYAYERERILKESLDRQMDLQRQETDSALSRLTASISARKRQLKLEFDSERDAIQAERDTLLDGLNSKSKQVSSSISGLNKLLSSLGGAIDKLIPQSRAQAQAEIKSAISLGERGRSLAGLDLQRAIGTLSEPSENLFGSFTDYLRDFNLTNKSLSDLRDLTSSQLTSEERALRSLTAQRNATERNTDLIVRQLEESLNMELASLDDQLAKAQEQIDVMRGIDNTLLSIDEAQSQLNEAIESESNLLAYITASMDKIGGAIEKLRVPPQSTGGGSFFDRVPPQSTLGDNDFTTRPISTPVSSTPQMQPTSANDTSSAAMVQLLTDIKNWTTQVATNTRGTTKQLERWDGDGLPAERQV